MSNREFAIEIMKVLPEDKVNAFLALFASENIKAIVETEMIAANPNRKCYDSFDELTREIFKHE